ncbi:EAL domain-containing protein [Halanaerobium praevalens]|uniref:Diguanylate cyclase/phosphodiesterase with extracellular sensor n=1 Tax=Halanaerobium praevalens (strain ATCC 33744 / DSM 2228 / GSL) TaxID=572479 RepID=E3DMX2_HALPG|nr:EAL domain-containing protein [Halanaerobium praevalens]ADO77461.1 diguanylate cyclase/phosphodiesterase with extracellular sensor [Halanaerobium praevalens DSM 2228]
MKILKKLSIQNKILLGIGISFILAMILLLLVIIFQFEDLLNENKNLIEAELLERKYDKYETLVKSRAEILSDIYAIRLREREIRAEKETDLDMKKFMNELNKRTNVDKFYFYIYDLDGNLISLPPNPELEGENRIDLKINGVPIIKNMINIIKKDGQGRYKYPYYNPVNDKIETKYSYLKKIEGTDLLIGAGGYESSYSNIVDNLLAKITTTRNETIYLFLVSFLVITLIISSIIFYISQSINKNIKKIISGFKRVENGQLNFKLNLNSGDEFETVVLGFNQMLTKIKNLSYNDPLTGLPNLNFLENNLKDNLNNLKKEEKIYLFTLDIANLSLINSSYGYQKANEILKEMYQRLSKILDKRITIARKNDEFIFYFVTKKNKEQIKKYAKNILNKLSKPYEINGNLTYLKLKIGIGINKKEDNYLELIRKSRLAVYFIDQKDQIKFFNQNMKGELVSKFDLESKLRQALAKDEFELYYQPQLKSENNQVIGVEALIRWYHPEEGMISPGKFIPQAEENGMILKLGDWVLKEAISQLKNWQDKGYNNLIMAVNIAPQQFMQGDFVKKIKKLLFEYQIEAQSLELEITERTVIKDIEYTIEVLNDLQKLGVQISIDDFGTGYSSLEYLNRFALNKLKIDKSFVHQSSNLNIVKTIIMMGNNLNLNVVAEGVETKAELDFLIQNKCHYYQGYYFAKPQNAIDVEKYFRKI